jgi:hypothetical protein
MTTDRNCASTWYNGQTVTNCASTWYNGQTVTNCASTWYNGQTVTNCASTWYNGQTVTNSAERNKTHERPKKLRCDLWTRNNYQYLRNDVKKERKISGWMIFYWSRTSQAPVYFIPAGPCLNFFLATGHGRREVLLCWLLQIGLSENWQESSACILHNALSASA